MAASMSTINRPSVVRISIPPSERSCVRMSMISDRRSSIRACSVSASDAERPAMVERWIEVFRRAMPAISEFASSTDARTREWASSRSAVISPEVRSSCDSIVWRSDSAAERRSAEAGSTASAPKLANTGSSVAKTVERSEGSPSRPCARSMNWDRTSAAATSAAPRISAAARYLLATRTISTSTPAMPPEDARELKCTSRRE